MSLPTDHGRLVFAVRTVLQEKCGTKFLRSIGEVHINDCNKSDELLMVFFFGGFFRIDTPDGSLSLGSIADSDPKEELKALTEAFGLEFVREQVSTLYIDKYQYYRITKNGKGEDYVNR